MAVFVGRKYRGRPWTRAFPFAALFLALPAPTPAAAEITFTSPQTLSVLEAASPQVAVDPQGRTTVVWQASDQKGSRLIEAVRIDSYGFPQAVQTLASFPAASNGCPCPKVVVDPPGNATIVWQAIVEGQFRIQTAQLDAGGVPHPVHTLSSPSHGAWYHDVAVDSLGRATVVWGISSLGTVEEVRLDSEGTPEEVHALNEENASVPAPDVAVTPEGAAKVAWDAPEGIQVVDIEPGGAVGPVQTVSPSGEEAEIPQVVLDSEGAATVAWWRGAGVYEVKSVHIDSDGTVGSVHTLSPPGQGALEPWLAIDAAGRVTAIWQDFKDRVNAVRLDQTGVPGTLYTLSDPERVAREPRVAAAPDGRVWVVWSHGGIAYAPEGECQKELEFDPESDVVQAALIGSDGQPAQVYEISARGEQALEAQLALDPLGRPRFVWETFDGTYFCPDVDTRIQFSQQLIEPETPPDPTPPMPPEDPPSEGHAILRLSGTARVNNGHLILRAQCAGDAGAICSGKVRLLARKPRRVMISRGRYHLAAGGRIALRLPLSRSGRRLIANSPRRRLRTTVRGPGLEARLVWVRLRKPSS